MTMVHDITIESSYGQSVRFSHTPLRCSFRHGLQTLPQCLCWLSLLFSVWSHMYT